MPFELVEASFRRKFNSSASAVWSQFPQTSQPLKNTPSVLDYVFHVVAFQNTFINVTTLQFLYSLSVDLRINKNNMALMINKPVCGSLCVEWLTVGG